MPMYLVRNLGLVVVFFVFFVVWGRFGWLVWVVCSVGFLCVGCGFFKQKKIHYLFFNYFPPLPGTGWI